jgi:ATP-dependent DNA helicase RecG
LPYNRAGILAKLTEDRLISTDVGNHWNISNLGAIIFAGRLDRFDHLARKAVRVVQYDGASRVRTKREQPGGEGYASGFEELIAFIDGLLPRNEHIGQAFRADLAVYPDIAIRELVANALVHQDMTVVGAGPMIEVFVDRIEITNPGTPLVDVRKIIGSPPRSRNEALAALMRRMNICEERGSGIVKVVSSAELYQLPAPDFRVLDDNMRVVLFAPRQFRDMDAAERVRACYQHTALRYYTGGRMTNASLRERLGIEERNAAQASRIIRDAIAAELIRPADPQSPRAGYVPFWA